MAIKNYIRMNSLINVDSIKVSTITSNTLKEAREEKDYLEGDLVISTDFASGITVDADYYSPSGQGGASMTFYKKTPKQEYYDLICEIKGGYFVGDYNIVNNEYYHYLVAVQMIDPDTLQPVYSIYQNKITDEKTGQDYLDYVKVNWNSWSICDIEESAEDDNTYIKKGGSVWKLAYNINDENLNQNLSISTWDTLAQYSKVSIGQKNFDSSTFTCLLGAIEEYKDFNSQQDIIQNKYKQVYGYTEKENIKDVYAREVDKLKAWKKFCSNGKTKLLKDVKGNSWIIQIIGNPNNNIDIKSNIQETMISFEWQEIVDINKVSIIGNDGFKKKTEPEWYEYDYINKT